MTDATQWQSSYNGFSYELLYNFILDVFEDTSGPDTQQRIKDLLNWWNKYVIHNALHLTMLIRNTYRKVFPARATTTANSRACFSKLRAQRAQREERLAQRVPAPA